MYVHTIEQTKNEKKKMDKRNRANLINMAQPWEWGSTTSICRSQENEKERIPTLPLFAARHHTAPNNQAGLQQQTNRQPQHPRPLAPPRTLL